MKNFIHLRAHSDFSITEGLTKITKMLNKALKCNMPALALTDYNNIFGALKFYKLAHTYGIKPIIGVDLKYFEEELKKEECTYRITALIMDEEGYYNIKKLLSLGYEFYKSNFVINKKWLEQFKKGLIILSGGLEGDIADALINNKPYELKERLSFWKEHYHNRYYLEINRVNQFKEEDYIRSILPLSIKEQLPIVATNNVYLLEPEDFPLHKIKISITQKSAGAKHIKFKNRYTREQYFRSTDEMFELFKEIPAAIENTVHIAKRCNLIIEINKRYYLPQYRLNKLKPEIYLKKEAKKGLMKRFLQYHDNDFINENTIYKYARRLFSELKIINKLGFASYFLIVKELIQWAKKNHIAVGPGRGSGAGSLVAYALEITEIDPMKCNLLFERFLNPEKVSMPDFDIDFCMEKRELIIDHVINLYGKESVSQIITFGNFGAKGAIRDVGRILGYSYKYIDNIAKLIPKDNKITILKVLQTNSKLRQQYHNDDSLKQLLDIAQKLEGTIRNVGKHAGGIVISPTTIIDFSAIYHNEGYILPVTQFDKYDLEDIGLVKFDFLGLTTLTGLSDCTTLINKKHVELSLPPIDINTLSLNDKKCFKTLRRLKTNSIFQLDSYGIKNLIYKLQPSLFEELIAILALYRPGPINSGMLNNFIYRKQKLEPIYYPDHDFQYIGLKSILEPTLGIIVYQEQVMQIAQYMAGYSLGEADILRRLMGKKDTEKMKKERYVFVAKATKLGHDNLLSHKMFNIIEKFAGYGFNKSHSASYALLSFQTVFLKTYYPSEFLASALSIEMNNIEKIINLLDEFKSSNLKILPPDINISKYKFVTNENGEIRYGLGAIKGIGIHVINIVITEREEHGLFKNLADLCKRLIPKKINLHIIKTFILTGCLDIFKQNRATLVYELEIFWKILTDSYNQLKKNQKSLFNIDDELSILDQKIKKQNLFWPNNYKLKKEYEYLGLYISLHPLSDKKAEVNFYNKNYTLNKLNQLSSQNSVKIIGVIVDYQQKVSAKGLIYYILTIEDKLSKINIFINNSQNNQYNSIFNTRELCLLQIQKRKNYKNNRDIYLLQKIIPLYIARQQSAKYLRICLSYKDISLTFFKDLHLLIQKYPKGILRLAIEIIYSNNRILFLCSEKLSILPTDDFLDELEIYLGSNKKIDIIFNNKKFFQL